MVFNSYINIPCTLVIHFYFFCLETKKVTKKIQESLMLHPAGLALARQTFGLTHKQIRDILTKNDIFGKKLIIATAKRYQKNTLFGGRMFE